MKKFMFILSVLGMFSSSNVVLASEQFDIECSSDAIVGKLWQRMEIPESNINSLFTLVDKFSKKKTHTAQEINIREYTKSWQADLLFNVPEEDVDSIRVIKRFVEEVNIIYGQGKFSPEVIKDSLELIYDKANLG